MLFYHDIIYHQAKVLVTDSTLLAGLLIHQSVRSCCLQPNHALSTNHAFINTWSDVYGYGEHMLGRIIAYNSKK